MAKRVFLFFLTNILVIFTISIIIQLLGIGPYIEQQGSEYGINYTNLMFFCLIWGMVGSFISLLMSKFMAKMMMGVKIIDPNRASGDAVNLVQTVHNLAKGAGISKMPEVGVYESPEVNAFATGPTKNRALVAVSTGLLHKMSKDELEGVLGHEIAHIENGDMVTMTLIQGVINAFVMFFARILAFAISNALSRNGENRSHFLEFGLIIAFQIAFGILGQVVVGYFSRIREYKADIGGAKLAGRPKMIAALEVLKGTVDRIDNEQQAVASLKISGRPSRIMALLSTHPPLSSRIERLKHMVAIN